MASLTTALGADTGARRPLLGRRWWRLWALLANLIVLAGVTVLWHRPYWRLAQVTYDGPPVWEEMAQGCVIVPDDSNYVRIDLDAIERRLAITFGDQADVSVKLGLPNALRVRVIPVSPELWLSAQRGVSADGSVLSAPVSCPSRPVVCFPFAQRSRVARVDAVGAIGAWAEVLSAEKRFADVVSEWSFALDKGWMMTAGDGRTRFVLGRSRLTERAAAAALFLAQPDSTVSLPCDIDLRFDGLVVARAKRDGHQPQAARRPDDRAPGAPQTRRETGTDTTGEGRGA